MADNLVRLWGEGASWKSDSTQHPHEATYLKLDCSKANRLLGISPVLDLATSLQWIVDWYSAFNENEDMRQISEAEIARYEDLLPA